MQADASGSTVNPANPLTTAFSWLMSALFGVSLLLAGWNLLAREQMPGNPALAPEDSSATQFHKQGLGGWPDALLLFTATVATMVSLARQLPGQNVILAAAVIALIGGAAHGLNAMTAIPFGPLFLARDAGSKILGLVPWPMPAIWVIVILNSRGVARLILRPWRKLRAYGFWLIGVTAALTVLFAVALDPFATKVNRYWIWQPTNVPLSWHGAPLVTFLGWPVTSLLILAFVTPALINKQPRTRKSAPDYHPLIVWLALLALFATGQITHGLWPAAGFCVMTGMTVGFLAIRGARW